MVSNIEEVRARGAHVIAVATEGNDAHRGGGRARDLAARAPSRSCRRCWQCIPLQQLAYPIARRRGLDVDKPRNLAKTVTVE